MGQTESRVAHTRRSQQSHRSVSESHNGRRLRRIDSAEVVGQSSKEHPAYTPSVLIVEDDPDILVGCEIVLKDCELDVLTASDGYDALHLAIEHNPDVIVSDLCMPRIGGAQLLTQLKALRETRDIPFVVLSCLADEYRSQLLDDGATMVLQKPTSLVTLRETIQSFLPPMEHGE